MAYCGACNPTPIYDPCCSFPQAYPVFVPACPPPRYGGSGYGFALVVVIVILLVILGAVYLYNQPAPVV